MTDRPAGRESDADLVRRHAHTKQLLAAGTKARDRMRPGGARDRKSRLLGSLTFGVLAIEREMRERGLLP